MASYFASLKEWTLQEWAATGSIIGKETVDPAVPSEATFVKTTAVSGKKNEGKFNVPTLAGGEKCIAATIHVYAKTTAEGKSLKFGFVSPAVFSEPTVKIANAWFTVSLTKAQAEALTQANLNELKGLIETIQAKAITVYEIYLALETETTGAAVTGKASGTLLLTGTAKGVATQKVEGNATGPLLLTGTATGSTKAVVSGKATGTLILTGTGTGSTKTGEAVTGKGSGTLTLTGTAKGSLRAVVTGSASGVLHLTGRAKGTTGPVTGKKVVIFVFDD
jgi:hypothetical protein